MEGRLLAIEANDERATEFLNSAQAVADQGATITLIVSDDGHDLAGITMTYNGRTLRITQWNVPIPAELGEHKIQVTAQNGRIWTHRVRIESSNDKPTVNIAKASFIVPTKKPDPQPPSSSPRPQWQTGLAWGSMGTGVASLVTSGVFSVLAVRKRDASNTDMHCTTDNRCDETGLALRHEAIKMGDGATATFAVGSVLMATSIGLFVARPKETPRTTDIKKSTSSWRIDMAPGGIGLSGTW